MGFGDVKIVMDNHLLLYQDGTRKSTSYKGRADRL